MSTARRETIWRAQIDADNRRRLGELARAACAITPKAVMVRSSADGIVTAVANAGDTKWSGLRSEWFRAIREALNESAR